MTLDWRSGGKGSMTRVTLNWQQTLWMSSLTLVSRSDSGTLSFSVYRKPTHTDRYLHFSSHHPMHVKRGLVKCLFNRAKEVTSGPTDLSSEHTHIANALVNNGYPKNFVRSCSVLRHRAQTDQEPPLTVTAPSSGKKPLCWTMPETPLT